MENTKTNLMSLKNRRYRYNQYTDHRKHMDAAISEISDSIN